MPQVINTNVMSLNAQRNLTTSQGALSQSLARLSSGLRINSAKDDAAGLAISERFTTQIRGMNQAIRNSNDGISLAQVAEGALQEVANNLQRIRELAVQARNATNSDSDRAALDAEVQQRIAEINRVASQTEFNGLKVLDGSFTEQVFQVGANYGQTISVEAIAAATGRELGLAGGNLVDYTAGDGTVVSGALAAGDLTINGTDVGVVEQDAAAIAEAINALGEGVTATASDATSGSTGAFTTTDGLYSLTVGGVTIVQDAVAGTTAADIDTAIGVVADQLEDAGISYTGTAAGGDLAFTLEGGENLEVVQSFATGMTAGGFASLGALSAGNDVTDTFYGAVSLTSDESYVIGGNAPGDAGLTAGAASITSTAYDAINVLSADSADTVLRVVDDALTTVNGSRADLGAVQNRFESVVANLSASVENLSASRSRIMDTDFAAETAALSRAQVLQQAGVAMLAQANMTPQNVLALLR
ncbi:MAG: flagellin [Gammaproteobacteria bacterium]|nr:flagellin [Gammaproteobacteria bacterium]